LKKLFILFITLVLCLLTAVACSASAVSTSSTAPSQTTPAPSGWTYQENPGYPYVSFEAIWGASPSDVFAVGDNGNIIHYDGNVWSTMNTGTIINLTGVWGSSPSDVFAVGLSGTILHYNGKTWSTMVSAVPNVSFNKV
jgi:photosystem II stability/assembly factor-like uncharacterized protein